ncbi:diguanylate cyclase [Nanoarchaeota archaeon]
MFHEIAAMPFKSYKKIVGLGTGAIDININLTPEIIDLLNNSDITWVKKILNNFNTRVYSEDFDYLCNELKKIVDLDDILSGGSTLNSNKNLPHVDTPKSVESIFLACLGNNKHSKFCKNDMKEHGVKFEGYQVEGSMKKLLVFVDPEKGERRFVETTGVAGKFDISKIDLNQYKNATWFYSTLYSLYLNDTIRPSLFKFFNFAKEYNINRCMNLASLNVIQELFNEDPQILYDILEKQNLVIGDHHEVIGTANNGKSIEDLLGTNPKDKEILKLIIKSMEKLVGKRNNSLNLAIPNLVCSWGDKGAISYERDSIVKSKSDIFIPIPAYPIENIANTTGCGDALASTILMYYPGNTLDYAVNSGNRKASMIAESWFNSLFHIRKAEIESMITDKLTLLGNRRFYEEIFASEYKRSRRFGNNFALAIIDIDDFKNVNDTYGHKAGDLVLHGIGKILKNPKILRQGLDSPIRWGGEEFAVLLRESNYEQAYIPLERVRKKIEDTTFFYQGQKIEVTVSIGFTNYIDGASQSQIENAADKALYDVKHSGKNNVKYLSPD